MDAELREEITARLQRKESPVHIRAALSAKGFSDADINAAFRKLMVVELSTTEARDRRNARLLGFQEVLDRVGYGTAAPQFVNILFVQAGASLFLLGLFNGFRALIGTLITSVLREYARVHRVSRNVISAAGILFGFSFLIMAGALWLGSVALFAAGMLFAGIGVVLYGDLYNRFVLETIRREKRGGLLRSLGQYGVLITMLAMILGGWLIDRFPIGGPMITLFGIEFRPIGYLLSFEITALAFILSGYLLTLVREVRVERTAPLLSFVREHYTKLCKQARTLTGNPYIALLMVATFITGVLEVLGHAYYGLFIYETFADRFFGGFLNIGVIYGFAILVSFIGPWFTRLVHRTWGLSPLLVFGTMLMAILPLVLVYNAHVIPVMVGLAVGVVGSSILGYGQGLLARKLMGEEARALYFMSMGVLITVPYLFLIPIGSWYAQHFGMQQLFVIIATCLVLIVTPLYFLLVLVSQHQRL